MPSVTIIFSLLLVVGSAYSAVAQNKVANATKTCVVDVSDMACSACSARVQKALLKIDGVTAASVSQSKGSAEISYDAGKTNPAALAKAITRKTGFPARARVDAP